MALSIRAPDFRRSEVAARLAQLLVVRRLIHTMARLSTEAIAYSAAALQVGDVQEALAVRNREFGRESGTFDDSVVRTIEFILGHTPVLLADCPSEVLEPLRIAAAMLELWGESSIRRFVTIEGELDYRFGTDAIAHMLHSHGCFLRSLEEFRSAGISRVSLLGAQGSGDCAACRAADGKKFTVDSVPELPLADCICEDKYGCKLIVIADADAA